MFCQNCGMANPTSGQFCSKCGSPLPSTASAGSTPGSVAVPGSSSATPPPLDGNPPTSGKAIASLVCGIFTFFLPASIAAVILGHLSLSEIRRSAGRLGGRGLATTGLVLGYLGLMVLPIMIVAAIAIPNLLRARMAANEATAVGSLRTINTAVLTYATEYENGFPSSLRAAGLAPGERATCNHAFLLDTALTSGRRSGYVFTYTPQYPGAATAPVISPKAAAKGCTSGGASGYTVTADPIQRGTTGQRSFFTDQSGLIRVSNNGESAAADSPPLE
jgi:type IV pilus assembly protein PilA